MLWALCIDRTKLKISTKLCAFIYLAGDQYIVGTRMLGDCASVCAYYIDG